LDRRYRFDLYRLRGNQSILLLTQLGQLIEGGTAHLGLHRVGFRDRSCELEALSPTLVERFAGLRAPLSPLGLPNRELCLYLSHQ
jgi:hypothetical protein